MGWRDAYDLSCSGSQKEGLEPSKRGQIKVRLLGFGGNGGGEGGGAVKSRPVSKGLFTP